MKENIVKDNNKIALYIIIGIIILACIGVLIYNNIIKDNTNNNNTENIIDDNDAKYINILLNDKKVLKSSLKLTDNAKINSSKIIKNLSIVFLDVIEPDFQFETHYLFCFDKDGKLILDVRDLKDSDNDNNRYKFNGKFNYDEDKNILTFYTDLFLGEYDGATGVAFNDKDISELTNTEKKILGNYSDEVKYEYKYENQKISFVEKNEINKLKDNVYYKDLFKN